MAFYCIVTAVSRVRGLKQPYDLFVEYELRDDAVVDFVESNSYRVIGAADRTLSDIRQEVRQEFRQQVDAATAAAKAEATAKSGLVGFRFPAAP